MNMPLIGRARRTSWPVPAESVIVRAGISPIVRASGCGAAGLRAAIAIAAGAGASATAASVMRRGALAVVAVAVTAAAIAAAVGRAGTVAEAVAEGAGAAPAVAASTAAMAVAAVRPMGRMRMINSPERRPGSRSGRGRW